MGTNLYLWNATDWDRANLNNVTNQNKGNVQSNCLMVVEPGELAQFASAAGAANASTTRAAGGAGVKNVCTSITASMFQGAAIPIGAQRVVLRDGAAGAGGIIWGTDLGGPGTLAGLANNVFLSGLRIIGSANTAMTLEFQNVGAANTFQTVSLTTYQISN